MLASKRNGTIYVGVTSEPRRRVEEHRSGTYDGFTEKYGVHTLVWIEWHEDIESAIMREKQLKRWKRAWKIALIEKENPLWKDLTPSLYEE